jgi:phosphoribosylaminoimidazolecarboxamide formyltransferase/IMP cyclohydrolase
MNTTKTIQSALISVFSKEGLEPSKKTAFSKCCFIFYRNRRFYKKFRHSVTAVEDVTSYPSILGGRVKTLHPKVGGILNRQDNESDVQQMRV